MRAIYISPTEFHGPARLALRPIAEVMSRPPAKVSLDAALEEALSRMIRTGLRHLVVVDRDGKCAGVLSDRSIAAAWAGDYAALSSRTVAAAMDHEPATVSVHDAVVDAAKLMRSSGVDAVAVVDDNGWPVGVITGSDLVALLAR